MNRLARTCLAAASACVAPVVVAQTFTLLPPAVSGISLSSSGLRGTQEPHNLWASPATISQTPLSFECVASSPDGDWALGRDGIAARRSLAGAQESLPPIPDGYSLSYATACSSDNSAVFGFGFTPAQSPATRGFRWTQADGTIDVGVLAGCDGTVINDCAHDGATAAGHGLLGGVASKACRWTSVGGLTGLDNGLGGTVSGTAAAISGDGEWTVGTDSVAHRAYRWTLTGLERLLPNPDAQVWQTAASDVSINGRRVVGSGTATGGQSQAIVWDGTGSATLLSDVLTRIGVTAHQTLLLATAESVSGDGRTVSGLCFDFMEGEVHAYVATLPPPCPADIGRQGGLPGPDGLADNNDFVIFIDDFFASDPLADFGRQGGLAGPDGLLDNNDFVVFIDLFFEGCGV